MELFLVWNVAIILLTKWLREANNLYDSVRFEVNVSDLGASGCTVLPAVQAHSARESSAPSQAMVSLVKGGTGQMVGRSISVKWLSTLFPLVTFTAKYRHFHD